MFEDRKATKKKDEEELAELMGYWKKIFFSKRALSKCPLTFLET